MHANRGRDAVRRRVGGGGLKREQKSEGVQSGSKAHPLVVVTHNLRYISIVLASASSSSPLLYSTYASVCVSVIRPLIVFA